MAISFVSTELTNLVNRGSCARGSRLVKKGPTAKVHYHANCLRTIIRVLWGKSIVAQRVWCVRPSMKLISASTHLIKSALQHSRSVKMTRSANLREAVTLRNARLQILRYMGLRVKKDAKMSAP